MSTFIDLEGIASRLLQIQAESGLNAKEFCRETQISESKFSQIKKGDATVNIDIINNVVGRWSEKWDPMWFVLGDANLGGPADLVEASGGSTEKLMQYAQEIGRLKQAIEQSRPKEIDRITVFYSDNTIANFVLKE